MKPAPELRGDFVASMLPHMARLLRPDSTIFRVTLALALFAWTALAFGIPPGIGANGPQASQPQAQITSVDAHCHDAMAGSAGSHDVSTPMPSMGHHDCCQTACQCLAASTAVMTVPRLSVAFVSSARDWPASPGTPISPALAAPPLRPPIV